MYKPVQPSLQSSFRTFPSSLKASCACLQSILLPIRISFENKSNTHRLNIQDCLCENNCVLDDPK